YIGTTECLYCHQELKDGFLKTSHARSLNDDTLPLDRQGCESCHGAGGAHAVLRSRGAIFAFDWEEPALTSDICLRCHSWLTSKNEWKHTMHGRSGLKCTECHNPHVGPDHKIRFLLTERQDLLCAGCHQDAAYDFSRFSHHPLIVHLENDPTSRALHCSDCHDVHAGQGFAMIAENRTQDLCLKCHIDKGGPFRFVHMSTEAGIGDGCLTCHLPHGSDSPWLGVADGRAMCMQCHTDRVDHNPSLTCSTSGCHTSIHGSNSSPLFF
ncbi:cytochrome c3 family protein, partial [bacterium]|nr:cytochrome c3 family protein [bacterium]